MLLKTKPDLILPGVNKTFPPKLREYIAKAVSISETNGFELGDSAKCKVFLTASRYNHTCTLNASQVWNGNISRLTVHVNKNIAVVEEITIPYVLLFAGQIQRGPALNGWDFQYPSLAYQRPTTSLLRGDDSRYIGWGKTSISL